MSLTAQRICILAAQVAKGPGFLQQAGEFLNTLLEELYLVRDLKVNRVTQPIALPVNTYGPINLEADYLRTYDMFYPMPSIGQVGSQFNGLTLFLTPITMQQFDAEFKSPSTANYPNEFATDLSPQGDDPAGLGLLYVYPQSSAAITLTHRYMKRRAAIVTPESSSTIPWFPDSSYLITELASRMMMITGDDRQASFHEQAELKLRPYLIMQGDEQQTVQNIKLDPKHFRSNRGLKATKVYPY